METRDDDKLPDFFDLKLTPKEMIETSIALAARIQAGELLIAMPAEMREAAGVTKASNIEVQAHIDVAKSVAEKIMRASGIPDDEIADALKNKSREAAPAILH